MHARHASHTVGGDWATQAHQHALWAPPCVLLDTSTKCAKQRARRVQRVQHANDRTRRRARPGRPSRPPSPAPPIPLSTCAALPAQTSRPPAHRPPLRSHKAASQAPRKAPGRGDLERLSTTCRRPREVAVEGVHYSGRPPMEWPPVATADSSTNFVETCQRANSS